MSILVDALFGRMRQERGRPKVMEYRNVLNIKLGRRWCTEQAAIRADLQRDHQPEDKNWTLKKHTLRSGVPTCP